MDETTTRRIVRREGDRVLVAYPSGEVRVESDAGESSEWLATEEQGEPLWQYDLSDEDCSCGCVAAFGDDS